LTWSQHRRPHQEQQRRAMTVDLDEAWGEEGAAEDEEDRVVAALRSARVAAHEAEEAVPAMGRVRRPGQQVRELKAEIQSLLAKVASEEGLPSAFACSGREEVCDSPIFESAEPERREVRRAEEEEMRERCAAYEVEISSLRLEAAAHKARARKLATESTQAAIFDDYERAICTLRRRCAALRRRNVQLETPTSPRSRVAKNLEASVAKLEAENADLRARLRTLPLARRLAKSQTRLAAQHATDLEKERKRLELERQRADRAADDLDRARRKIADLSAENDALLQDRRHLTDKLRQLRDYVHSLPVSTDGPEKTRVADFKRPSHCRKLACSVSHNNHDD